MPIARRLLFPPYTASSKRVFTEVSNYVHGPKVQGRGRSFAASVPSDKPIIKGQKVTREERKAMVRSFVDRYRSTNLGIFPSAPMAQKEVGGSYYIIKRIIEELRVEANMPPKEITDKKWTERTTRRIASSKRTIESSAEIEEVSSTQFTQESEPFTDGENIASTQLTNNESSAKVEEVSSSQIRAYGQFCENAQPVTPNGLDTPDSNKHLQVKMGPEASTLDDNLNSTMFVKPTRKDDDSDPGVTESFLLKAKHSKVSIQSPEKPKIDAEDKTGSEDVLDFDVPLHKPEQKDQPDLAKLSRPLPQSQKDEELLKSESQKDEELLKSEGQKDEEIQKKPSIWGNLKSLADGIMNIWRKL